MRIEIDMPFEIQCCRCGKIGAMAPTVLRRVASADGGAIADRSGAYWQAQGVTMQKGWTTSPIDASKMLCPTCGPIVAEAMAAVVAGRDLVPASPPTKAPNVSSIPILAGKGPRVSPTPTPAQLVAPPVHAPAEPATERTQAPPQGVRVLAAQPNAPTAAARISPPITPPTSTATPPPTVRPNGEVIGGQVQVLSVKPNEEKKLVTPTTVMPAPTKAAG